MSDANTRARQQRAEELFTEVREIAAPHREAAIDAGSDDPWVRAEVRSLLTFDSDASATLGVTREDSFDPEALIGVSVDGFTIRSVIGTGGMGAVFLADQHSPSRRVAIKVFAASITRSSALERFHHESEILARLDHPSIARVIAAGTLTARDSTEARPYFAMELVEDGKAITQWSTAKHRTVAQRIETFAVVCDAVGSGHHRGIVHLDLKPGNVLVGNDGCVHVIDYGIAQWTRASDDAGLSDAPASNAPRMGTPQYMSPEQFSRDTSALDSRCDVYALGLILYELLTHQLPYQTGGRALDSAARIVRESMPAQPHRVGATLPRGLDAVVLKALAKRPDDRYGTAFELADELRRWLADEPVLAAPATAVDSLRRFVRKNRTLTAAILIAALAIVGGGAASLRFALHASREAARANAAAARANLRAASASLALDEPADAMEHLRLVPTEERGWETRHLARRVMNFELFAAIGSEILTVTESAARNEVIAGITPGYIAIADRTLTRPLDVIDMRPHQSKRTGTILSIDASPDGDSIVAVNEEGTLLLIDRESKRVDHIASDRGWCAHLGSVLCAVGWDGAIELFDAATHQTRGSIAGIGSPTDVSFNSDGSVLLIGHGDGRIRCVDFDAKTHTLTERWCTGTRDGGTRAVAISPAASCVAVAWRNGLIARLDARSGATVSERDLPGGPVFDLAISPDEQTIAASSWTQTVRLVDRETLAIKSRLGGTLSHVWGIAFSEDASRLFGGLVIEEQKHDESSDVTYYVGAWLLDQADAILDTAIDHSPRLAVWDELSQRLTSIDHAGVIREIDVRARTVHTIGTIDVMVRGTVRCLARHDSMIALGLNDGQAVLMHQDASGTCREQWSVAQTNGPLSAIGFSPDGKVIAFGGAEDFSVGALNVIDGTTMWRAQRPEGHSNPGRRRAAKPVFLANGASVTYAVVGHEQSRPIFRTRDGVIIAHERDHPPLEADDALYRASTGDIYTLGITGMMLRDSSEGALTFSNVARNGGVMCADDSFRRLFVSARDGATRIIDSESMEELMRLDSPAGVPLAITFDNERDSLTVITTQGILRTWNGIVNYTPPTSSGPTEIERREALPYLAPPSASQDVASATKREAKPR